MRNVSSKQDSALLQIILYLHHRLERAQKRDGFALSLSQYRLLYMVREGPARSVELATASGMTKPSVGALVGQLEENGWIERRRLEDDKRAASIRITAAGTRVLSRFEAQMQNVLEDFLGRDNLAEADADLQWLLQVMQEQRQNAHREWQLRKSAEAGD